MANTSILHAFIIWICLQEKLENNMNTTRREVFKIVGATGLGLVLPKLVSANEQRIKGPICALISCSKDQIPGICAWDIKDNSTLQECFEQAIARSKELTVIGPPDKIVLVNLSYDYLFNTSYPECKRKTFYCWEKINGEWIGNFVK